MSTGSFENWAGNIADIGPIYPFVGAEGLLVLLGVAFWIAWHIWQLKQEARVYRDEVQKVGDPDTLKKLVSSEDPKNP